MNKKSLFLALAAVVFGIWFFLKKTKSSNAIQKITTKQTATAEQQVRVENSEVKAQPNLVPDSNIPAETILNNEKKPITAEPQTLIPTPEVEVKKMLAQFSATNKNFKINLPANLNYEKKADEDGDWEAIVARDPNENLSYIVAGSKFDIKDEDAETVSRALFNLNSNTFEDVDVKDHNLDIASGLEPVHCFKSELPTRQISGCHVVSKSGHHFIIAVDGTPATVKLKESEIDQTYDSMSAK